MNFFKKLRAVRGAVCCKNEADDILHTVTLLYTAILEKNRLKERDIVSIQFTVTADLTELNPASALRRSGFARNLPLFCSQEPLVKNSLACTIRILLHYYGRAYLFVYTNKQKEARKFGKKNGLKLKKRQIFFRLSVHELYIS